MRMKRPFDENEETILGAKRDPDGTSS